MRKSLAVSCFTILASLFTCQRQGSVAKKPAYGNITPVQLKERLKKGDDLVLLDVRTEREFTGPLGHLDGALLIPVQELDDRIGELSDKKDKEIIAYCRSGNRSVRASEILRRHDFKKVTNLLGGMKAWNASVRGEGKDKEDSK